MVVRFLPLDWGVISSLSLVFVALLYIYLKSGLNYWKQRGFPEVSKTPLPFFGHTFKLLLGRESFEEALVDLYAATEDKPFAGFLLGNHPCLLVKDPELIRNILVADFPSFLNRAFLENNVDPWEAEGLHRLEGNKWKIVRKRLKASFSAGRMKEIFPTIYDCCAQMLEFLRKETDGDGSVIEIKDLMARYTTDVIGTCAFGVQCDVLRNPKSSEFRRMIKMLFQVNLRQNSAISFHERVAELLYGSLREDKLEKILEYFRKFMKACIKNRERIAEEEKLHDGDFSADERKEKGYFIDTLVTLRNGADEEGNHQYTLSHDDLTAHTMLFFLAGLETTSSLLSKALFAISSSPEGLKIQQDLRDEIDGALSIEGGKITYESLRRIQLLEHVLAETLRLYPPAGVIGRKCMMPYKIPGTKLILETESRVFIPVQPLQNDPKYFQDPKKFDPDRFLKVNQEQRPNFSYLPFGAGPRHCIGQHFAYIQAQLGLFSLLSKFEFQLSPKKPTGKTFSPDSFILSMEEGIWLNVKQRRKEFRRNACTEKDIGHKL